MQQDHTSGLAATDGTWRHIAVTWNSSGGQTILYDNGRQVPRAPGKLRSLSFLVRLGAKGSSVRMLRHWASVSRERVKKPSRLLYLGTHCRDLELQWWPDHLVRQRPPGVQLSRHNPAQAACRGIGRQSPGRGQKGPGGCYQHLELQPWQDHLVRQWPPGAQLSGQRQLSLHAVALNASGCQVAIVQRQLSLHTAALRQEQEGRRVLAFNST